MAKAIRILLGTLVALTLAGGLLVAVELFSAVVYPMPPGSTNTKEEVCAHVAAYPQWILAVVVPAWSGTALASTWRGHPLRRTRRGNYRLRSSCSRPS